jgi:hypothetical protein
MKNDLWIPKGEHKGDSEIISYFLNPPESPFNIGIIAQIHVLQLKGDGERAPMLSREVVQGLSPSIGIPHGALDAVLP